MEESALVDELKDRNENLSRELAESVREIVEYRHAYRELRLKADVLKKIFADFLVKNGYQTSDSLANHYVDEMASREMLKEGGTNDV